MTTEEKKAERIKRENAYRNNYNKENYDRINAMFPKGTKERIKATGESASGLLNRLLEEEFKRLGV